jgi:hypothetical protein
MKLWPCSVLFVCAVASAQIGGANWLSPPDAILTKAIEDGYTGRKLAKVSRYMSIESRIKPGAPFAKVEVIPPIMCALQQAQSASNKLQPQPTLDFVKAACSGRVTVVILHYSQSLNANWPCVFQNQSGVLQPTSSVLDSNPQVTSYDPGGLSTGDVVGYQYVDAYVFTIPPDWPTSSSLIYVDDRAVHHAVTVDFSVFAKDVLSRQ